LDLSPDVEPALSSFIESCLSFDVDRRPTTACEVRQSLLRLASRPGRLKRWAWRRRGALTASLVPVSAALVLGGYALANLPPLAERQFLAAQRAEQKGDYQGALARLDSAESNGFDHQQIVKLRGHANYRLAQQAFSAGDFPTARDFCTKALDAGERSGQAYLLRARSQLQLG
jgi:tetratricopeptide (TPR) repeat protein